MYKRLQASCISCRKQITASQLNSHVGSKTCKLENVITVSDTLCCVFCNKTCSSVNSYKQHFLRCVENPNRIANKGNTSPPWNKGLSKFSDGRILKVSMTMKEIAKNTPNFGRCFSSEKELERIAKLSDFAKKSGLGGYQPNAGRSKKCKVVDSYGTEVTLQSSYELICSQVLDLMGVKWVRPGALKYEGRNYFPDFYLPEFDVYLDPKNDFKAKQDAEKIASVIRENNVKVYVLLKTQLNEQSLRSILDMQSADNR